MHALYLSTYLRPRVVRGFIHRVPNRRAPPVPPLLFDCFFFVFAGRSGAGRAGRRDKCLAWHGSVNKYRTAMAFP